MPILREGGAGWLFGQSYNRFGRNPDIDGGSLPEEVWAIGGTVTWPSAAATASVVSTDAGDAAAGTGAQTIRIFGVDAAFNAIQEDLSMNGLTPVVSTASFLFVDRITVLTNGADASETNLGDITASIGGTDVCRCEAGFGISLQALLIVPAPQISTQLGHLHQFSLFCGKQAASFAGVQLIAQPPGGARSILFDGFVHSQGTNIYKDEFIVPIRVIPGTRLWARCPSVSSNNVSVGASFTLGYW